jgi:hypothetical protein
MRDAITQMTRIGDRGEALDAIRKRLDEFSKNHSGVDTELRSQGQLENSQPYRIGQSDRAEDAVNIPLWVQAHAYEPSVKVRIYRSCANVNKCLT